MLHPDTANLAAFITIAAKPIASVKSMDDAVLTGKPVCNLKGSLVIPRVEALYPRVRWGVLPEGKEKVSRWEQAQRLVDADGCDGLLSTMMTYRAYKARPEYCSLEIQQVVVPQLGDEPAVRLRRPGNFIRPHNPRNQREPRANPRQVGAPRTLLGRRRRSNTRGRHEHRLAPHAAGC